MIKMKRLINLVIPVGICNIGCTYCYISQKNYWSGEKLPKLPYAIETVAKALSVKRLGGVCYINICGEGETLLPNYITDFIKLLLEDGHYLFIITNGTLTDRFEQILTFPQVLLKRLGFKFSYHYKELKRLDLTSQFFDNAKRLRTAGSSVVLEIGNSDEYINHIDDIKRTSIDNIGALPHVLELRDNAQEHQPRLTALPSDEYLKIWRSFDSPMFELLTKYRDIQRREFCYAGDWAINVLSLTGDITQCFIGWDVIGNIYDDIDMPLRFAAIGSNCRAPYCLCGYVLAQGIIPKLRTPPFMIHYATGYVLTVQNGYRLNFNHSCIAN
jgi:organic radical activating enzyme